MILSGSIYTKRLRPSYDNSVMMLVILFSLKTMELLQNEVATHFQVTPLFFNENTCRSIDTGAGCKWALIIHLNLHISFPKGI